MTLKVSRISSTKYTEKDGFVAPIINREIESQIEKIRQNIQGIQAGPISEVVPPICYVSNHKLERLQCIQCKNEYLKNNIEFYLNNYETWLKEFLDILQQQKISLNGFNFQKNKSNVENRIKELINNIPLDIFNKKEEVSLYNVRFARYMQIILQVEFIDKIVEAFDIKTKIFSDLDVLTDIYLLSMLPKGLSCLGTRSLRDLSEMQKEFESNTEVRSLFTKVFSMQEMCRLNLKIEQSKENLLETIFKEYEDKLFSKKQVVENSSDYEPLSESELEELCKPRHQKKKKKSTPLQKDSSKHLQKEASDLPKVKESPGKKCQIGVRTDPYFDQRPGVYQVPFTQPQTKKEKPAFIKLAKRILDWREVRNLGEIRQLYRGKDLGYQNLEDIDLYPTLYRHYFPQEFYNQLQQQDFLQKYAVTQFSSEEKKHYSFIVSLDEEHYGFLTVSSDSNGEIYHAFVENRYFWSKSKFEQNLIPNEDIPGNQATVISYKGKEKVLQMKYIHPHLRFQMKLQIYPPSYDF